MLLSSYFRSEAILGAFFRLPALLFIILCSVTTFAEPRIQEVINRTLTAEFAPQALDVERLSAQEKTFSELEIRRDPEDLQTMKSMAAEMMNEYLAAGHQQEALWILRRADLTSEAQYLEDQIKRTFLTKKRIRTDDIHESRNAHWWVFDNGIQGLGKIPELYWERSVEYEVFAYELDKFLGLNRVPVTVAVTEPGNKQYSLQLRLKDSAISRISFKDDKYLSHAEELGEVYLFDYLTGQTDRHNLNSLRARTGRLALIDNGRAMGHHLHRQKMAPPPSEYIKSGVVLNNRILARLRNIRLADLYQHFGNILTTDEIKEVHSRIRQLRIYYLGTDYVEPEAEPIVPESTTDLIEKCRRLFGL